MTVWRGACCGLEAFCKTCPYLFLREQLRLLFVDVSTSLIMLVKIGEGPVAQRETAYPLFSFAREKEIPEGRSFK